MLKRLLELKPTCLDLADTFKELKLSNIEWTSIDNMVQALYPAKKATIALQRETLTLGDFYGIWLKCYSSTKTINSGVAEDICKAMDTRGLVLKNNPIFLAAIYLDPRFQWSLCNNEKEIARTLLKEIWNLMVWLETGSNSTILIEEELFEDDLNDDLEQYIRSQSLQISKVDNRSLNECSSIINVDELLRNIENITRVHHSVNIMEYWNRLEKTKPELHKIVMVILAIPATQVSVERAFSGLKYILSDLRTSLKSEMLENILLISSNYTF